MYTSTPQSIQPLILPSNQIDKLSEKIDEMCKKLSALDIVNEKLTKVERTMSNLVNNVDKISKRVDEVEKKHGIY